MTHNPAPKRTADRRLAWNDMRKICTIEKFPNSEGKELQEILLLIVGAVVGGLSKYLWEVRVVRRLRIEFLSELEAVKQACKASLAPGTTSFSELDAYLERVLALYGNPGIEVPRASQAQ